MHLPRWPPFTTASRRGTFGRKSKAAAADGILPASAPAVSGPDAPPCRRRWRGTLTADGVGCVGNIFRVPGRSSRRAVTGAA